MIPFSSRLIQWQHQDGRHDLPWQVDDPYRIWLSEIMLQQTQVATVIPYFLRFTARFPDIATLAEASTDEVLALWSGLGYYARARNLHQAAHQIMARFGGTFPKDLTSLTSLPGIGRSTAAAIATFSFGTRAAILDGNVKRVLTRWAGIEGYPGLKVIENKLWQLAESLLPHDQLPAYTQGLMDLGSRVCTPRRPACLLCPINTDCVARLTGREEALPTPKQRKPIPERSTVMLLITNKKKILLQRRPPAGIWGGLWSLPEISDISKASAPVSSGASVPTGHGANAGIGEQRSQADHPIQNRTLKDDGYIQIATEYCESKLGLAVCFDSPRPCFTHTFTHFYLSITPLLGTVTTQIARVSDANGAWFERDKALACGLPAPVRSLIESMLVGFLIG